MEGNNKNTTRRGISHNHLWKYRQARGYSQTEVAQLLGHQRTSHVAEYERGKRTPSLQTAMNLAVILSTSVDVLFAQMREELRREIQVRRNKLFVEDHE